MNILIVNLPSYFYNVNNFYDEIHEVSYFDLINMTGNGLEYDRKKFPPTNMNVGT